MHLNRYDGMRKGVAILPNLLTTANLFCGFYAIIQSIRGQHTTAVWLVIIATVFDFLDGRVARLTGTQSDFGVEYDSLSDLTTFCMAPAVMLYNWGMNAFGKFGVATGFLYFACGALRLARFNVQAAGVEKVDFQGLPTPAAAGTAVSFILFYKYVFGTPDAGEKIYLLLALMVLLGLLMVSDIRYKSTKGFKKRTRFFYLVAIVALIFILLSRPEIMLFTFGICYITSGLIGRINDARKNISQLAYEAEKFPPQQRPFRKRWRRRRNRGEFAPRGENPTRIPDEKHDAAEPRENIVNFPRG